MVGPTVQRKRFSEREEDEVRVSALLDFLATTAANFVEDPDNDLCGLRGATFEECGAAFRHFREALLRTTRDGSLVGALQSFVAYKEIVISPGDIVGHIIKAIRDAEDSAEPPRSGAAYFNSLYEDLLPNTARLASSIIEAVRVRVVLTKEPAVWVA